MSGTDGSCIICLEEVAAPGLQTRRCCRARVCAPCLRQHVNTLVTARQVDIPCPNDVCGVVMNHKETVPLLESENIDLFCQDRVDGNPDGNRKTCPRCKHITLQPARNDGDDSNECRVECKQCQFVWCFNCQSPQHEGKSCSDNQEDEGFLVWTIGTNSQITGASFVQRNAWECPGCKTFIQRSIGCRHMTCSQCHTNFCYDCGQRRDAADRCGCSNTPTGDNQNALRANNQPAIRPNRVRAVEDRNERRQRTQNQQRENTYRELRKDTMRVLGWIALLSVPVVLGGLRGFLKDQLQAECVFTKAGNTAYAVAAIVYGCGLVVGLVLVPLSAYHIIAVCVHSFAFTLFSGSLFFIPVKYCGCSYDGYTTRNQLMAFAAVITVEWLFFLFIAWLKVYGGPLMKDSGRCANTCAWTLGLLLIKIAPVSIVLGLLLYLPFKCSTTVTIVATPKSLIPPDPFNDVHLAESLQGRGNRMLDYVLVPSISHLPGSGDYKQLCLKSSGRSRACSKYNIVGVNVPNVSIASSSCTKGCNETFTIKLGHKKGHFNPIYYKVCGQRASDLFNTSWEIRFVHLHSEDKSVGADNLGDATLASTPWDGKCKEIKLVNDVSIPCSGAAVPCLSWILVAALGAWLCRL